MSAQASALSDSGALMLWCVGAGKPLGIEPLTDTRGGSAIVVAEDAQTLDWAVAQGMVTESTRLFVSDEVARSSSFGAQPGCIWALLHSSQPD